MCDKTRLVHSKKVSFFDLGGRSLFLEKLCDANLLRHHHPAAQGSQMLGDLWASPGAHIATDTLLSVPSSSPFRGRKA